MLKEILPSQQECVTMLDFNLPNIDWTLQRQTHTPSNKMMQLHADYNLTQHVHETTRQNNILNQVISMEEELIVNLKIIDKIGNHQVIQYSIKTEKGTITSNKTTTLEEQILQCRLYLITKPLNNQLSKIMQS